VLDTSAKQADAFEPGGSINDEITSYRAWDPRLHRVDGFVSRSATSDDHPTVVPFASETAAGAFYDMVFTIEKGIGDKMSETTVYKEGTNTKDSNDNEKTSSDNTFYTVDKNSGETITDVNKSTKNFYLPNKTGSNGVNADTIKS